MSENNPCAERLDSLMRLAARRRLDAVVVFGEANIRSLTGVVCDNGCLLLDVAGGRRVVFHTDFRYVPMVHRVAPWLCVREVKRKVTFMDHLRSDGIRPKRLGYESTITAARYLALKKRFPKAALVDVSDDILSLRAVKSVEEITRIAAAAALNDEIWARARKDFKPGMTEKEIQRVIQAWMIALGDGEAFETIVCAGANAAECHHVPDDTVWRRGEPLLVDMGVKLDGVCSDMTRNVKAARDPEYAKVYDIVLKANEAAIKAATAPEALKAHVKDAAAAKALLGKVKGAYASDPMVLTVAAPVSQQVMKPCKCPKQATCRALWSAALLDTAAQSKDAYVQMFCLDQLRWCGLPCQAEKVSAHADVAADKSVKDFADWVARELAK